MIAYDDDTDVLAEFAFTDPLKFRGEPCAIYPRVSDPKQAERDKTSLDDQERSGRAYAARFGLVVDEECVISDVHTSTTLDRPNLQRLIATMKRKGVKHLISDRVDRISREGVEVAISFVHYLRQNGITLHVTYPYPFAVVGDMAVDNYIQLAKFARLDNKLRSRNFKRTRRSRAANGQYVRGNKAPFGYRYIPGDPLYRLEADRHEFQYPVLERMCRERLAGKPYRRIAEALTADGIPTSRQQAGHRGASTGWTAHVVRQIVENPVTKGTVTAFRHSYGPIQPADAHLGGKHKKAWRKITPKPGEKVMVLPEGTVDVHPLTPDEYEQILAMRGEKWANTSVYPEPKGAMLIGGLAKHDCGGTLRLSRRRKRTGGFYSYYTCTHTQNQPHTCPGALVNVKALDAMVWRAVCDEFLQPGQIERWAEEQRQADLARTPESHLSAWQQTLSDAHREAERYRRAIARAETDEEAELFQKDMRSALERAKKADAMVATLEAQLADVRRYQAFVDDVAFQISRYHGVLRLLHPDSALWIPTLANLILRALGVSVRAWRDPARGVGADDPMLAEIVAEVEVTVGPSSLRPWFDERPEIADMEEAVYGPLGEVMSLVALTGLREGEEAVNVPGKLEGYRLVAEWLVKEYGQEEAVRRWEAWRQEQEQALAERRCSFAPAGGFSREKS